MAKFSWTKLSTWDDTWKEKIWNPLKEAGVSDAVETAANVVTVGLYDAGKGIYESVIDSYESIKDATTNATKEVTTTVQQASPGNQTILIIGGIALLYLFMKKR